MFANGRRRAPLSTAADPRPRRPRAPRAADRPGPAHRPLLGIPQGLIALTDSKGKSYTVTGAADLLRGLRQIADSGAKVASLFVKGHGHLDMDLIMFSTPIPPRRWPWSRAGCSSAVRTSAAPEEGHRPDHPYRLDRVGSGPLAEQLSGYLSNGTIILGNTLPYAIGVPLTSMSLGRYVQYRDGRPI